jgi:hypothetical protein
LRVGPAAGCLQLFDEDFDDFEGGGDGGVLVRVWQI